ncbi:hypothetical protein Tco_1305297 [Tanacetum coccineum]
MKISMSNRVGVDFDDSSKDDGVLDGALGGLGDCGVGMGDEYVPRFREVEVYIKTGVSLVERHMMEQMTSKGKGVVIEEIMDHDVNDVVGKEFDGESGNSGKLPLLEWNQSSQVGKDGTVVDNDFCVFDSNNEFPPPWSAEIMITNRTKDDGASISGKEGDLETWFSDEEVDQDIDVEWQDDPYHLVDEPEEISDMFAKLDQAMDELDQVIEVEDVFSTWMAFGENTRDLGSFGEETDKIMTLHQKIMKNCAYRAWRRRRHYKATASGSSS